MAETAVSIVIQQLAPLVKAEVNLLKGVRGEVERIRGELESIHPYLRNADQRAEEEGANGDVAVWVRQVRQVSYRIEDVIDEYTLQLAQRTPRHGCVGCLHRLTHLIIKLKPRHVIASQIEDIKRTLQDIQSRRLNYGLQSIAEGSSRIGNQSPAWNDPRVASLFLEEAELVGIDSPRDELMGWMAEEASSKRTVISVVGCGGLGKTTLVKRVYDSQIRTDNFVCHAWIAVSQSYKMEELLRTLIRHLHEASKDQSQPSPLAGIEAMKQAALIDKLRNYLELKRYVVVFDDVWDSKLWKIVKLALPDKKNGSRVIITTRTCDVASSCKESPADHIKELQPLPDQKAFELFCQKAFQSENDGRCPPELVESAENIVKKCCGVPLAIVTIGGVLSNEDKIAYKWNKFHDSLGHELKSNPHLQDVERILLFSYRDLPWHLKSCFLYFGILPEDYSVSCVRLVRIWVAEGFIKEEESKTLEETAQAYLAELINRSLVQTSKLDFDGKVRSCRVHDLMRDIILSKFKELSFCQILDGKHFSFDSQSRRLSINRQDDDDEDIGLTTINTNGPSSIRSLFVFRTNDLPESSVYTFTSNFKYLKVMDFEGAPLNLLPEELGNLLNLRYLSVRDTKVKKLPRSIGRLRKLLTLDLKRSLVSVLPTEINTLHKLRHLLAYHYGDGIQTGVKIEERFGCLESLQKLYFVEANHGDYVIEELKRLRQLRKLGIKKLRMVDGKGLCDAVGNMKHLETLDVLSARSGENHEIIDLQHISSPPLSLQRLYLKGRLERFPQWISKLQNLIRLRLRRSGLKEDPLKCLQALPCLLEFGLSQGSYDGESLCFETAGFQKLKVLLLWDLKALKSVIIEEGALPRLQDVTIWDCPKLEHIPEKLADHLFKYR